MSIATLQERIGKRTLSAFMALCLVLGGITPAQAVNEREKARRIHDRLTGVPPSNLVLTQMTAMLVANNEQGAADLAMQNPNFLNVTVKNLVIPWTNLDMTVFADFNDAAATVIGLISDGSDFRRILYDDVIYVGTTGGLSAYSNSNNNHYSEIEHRNLDLRTELTAVSQSTTTGHPAESIAGVMTTRASARAFFDGGTNRAMFRQVMLNYLCVDLEQVQDITRTPNYIRQDVSRSPGGDSSIFLNNCIGCHAGMDGMMGAFAYYEWTYTTDVETGQMTYNSAPITYLIEGNSYTSRVSKKLRINPNNFPSGFFMVNDSWINYWRTGVNANMGWGLDATLSPSNATQAPYSNSGAASLGREMANTEAFARCQVVKVYRHICFNDPSETTLQTMVTNFKGSNFNMQTVFADAAINCQGTF